MAKGLRKTIILNPDNPKEKAILDALDKQYNYSEFIKDVLYNKILHDGNCITIPLPYHDNTMVIPLSHNGNTMITELSSCDNHIITSLPHDDNDNKNEFLININDLDDTNVNIDLSEQEDPGKNALDFLKNSF